MRLCPRCNKRLRASRRMRDRFNDLGDEYDFFDEEIDAVVDEAIEWNGISRWAQLLRRAEGTIRLGLNAFHAGRRLVQLVDGSLVDLESAINLAEQTLLQAADEFGRVTDRVMRTSAVSAIRNAIRHLQSARFRLQGRSPLPGSPADSMRRALEYIGRARSAMGLP
jgi:hypothetical protein